MSSKIFLLGKRETSYFRFPFTLTLTHTHTTHTHSYTHSHTRNTHNTLTCTLSAYPPTPFPHITVRLHHNLYVYQGCFNFQKLSDCSFCIASCFCCIDPRYLSEILLFYCKFSCPLYTVSLSPEFLFQQSHIRHLPFQLEIVLEYLVILVFPFMFTRKRLKGVKRLLVPGWVASLCQYLQEFPLGPVVFPQKKVIYWGRNREETPPASREPRDRLVLTLPSVVPASPQALLFSLSKSRALFCWLRDKMVPRREEILGQMSSFADHNREVPAGYCCAQRGKHNWVEGGKEMLSQRKTQLIP